MVTSIRNRRSIRKFRQLPADNEKITSVLRAAMQAPSAGNTQCWEFIVVKDEEAKKFIASMSRYSSMAGEAAFVIITLANLKKTMNDMLWWVEDLSAATENILLQLEEEGLGGVWIGTWPDEDRVRKLREFFSIPEDVVPFSVVACGYKGEEKPFEDRYDENKVHWERY